MIVIFDRQHWGKPGRNDLGAGYDIDGDGVVAKQEREAILTPLYYGPAKDMLEAEGCTVHVLDSGWYSSRWAQANAMAEAHPEQLVAYVPCHLNAGRGRYSSFFWIEGSSAGNRLAKALGASFGGDGAEVWGLPGVDRVRVWPAEATGTWRRAYNTMKGIYDGPRNICSACVEPFFLDQPRHAWMADERGGAVVGQRLARGLLAWRAGEIQRERGLS